MTLALVLARDDVPNYSDYPAVAPLFCRFAEMDSDDSERPALRERLILIHLPLARNLARRFARRGEPVDDLLQVARIGLVKSVDRFDPVRGTAFLSFAVPTITGEIRRHFRDHAWHIRPPRRLQDLHLQLEAATTELLHRDHRTPTAGALARHLGVPVAEIHEALQVTSAYAPMRLDAPVAVADGPALADSLGGCDEALGMVDNHESLKRLIAALPERERRILAMRFVGEHSQTRIALEVGLSQMQVSRLLSATLARLRSQLLADE